MKIQLRQLKRFTTKAFFALSLCASMSMSTSFATQAFEGLRVVTNTSTEVPQLTKQEVINLFMGGGSRYDLMPVELAPDNNSRVMFNTMVIGLTEARIQSYWAQMRFSGRMKPPKMLNSEDEVLAYFQSNENVVAYLSSDQPLPDGLTVIYELEAN